MCSRFSQNQGSEWCRAGHLAPLPGLLPNTAPRGESSDRVRLVLSLGPSWGLREVRSLGAANARPPGVAEHVDKVQAATNSSRVPLFIKGGHDAHCVRDGK